MPKIPMGRAVAAVALTFAALGGTACSSGDDAATTTTLSTEQRYCAAWGDVIDAFVAFDEVDIVANGTSSLEQASDDLEGAVDDLEAAADEQLSPSIAAFVTSLQELGTTLTSPELPVDRTDEVLAARSDVDAAWAEMVDTLTTKCPEVETPTS